MPDLVSGGIEAAAGLAQLVAGAVNAHKTKKIAKELERTRPKYNISQLAKDDLSLAESEASNGGFSASAETAYNNLNNQQFSSLLDAILKGGGSVNNVSEVYGNGEEGRQRLALLSDQMRLAKINNLMKVRDMYRGEQDKEFQINQFAPYRDKVEANNNARTQAQNQLWGGIGTVADAGMNYFGGKYQENQYDDYFGGQPQPVNTTPGLEAASGFNFNPQRNSRQPSVPGQTNFNPKVDVTDFQDYQLPNNSGSASWWEGGYN